MCVVKSNQFKLMLASCSMNLSGEAEEARSLKPVKEIPEMTTTMATTAL